MNPSSTRPFATFLTRLIWLSVLPPVLTATWLATKMVLSQQEASRQQAFFTAEHFRTSIDHFLNNRIKSLNILAVSPLADDPQRWPDLYREAQGFRESYGSHVILADTGEPMRMLLNTRIPLDAPLPPLPRPKGNAAAPKALATGQPAVGDTFMGPIAKEPLVAIVVPGIRAGKVAHLLLSIIETSQLQQRLDQETLPASWALTLKDGKGEVIAQRIAANFDPQRDVDDQDRFELHSTVAPWTVVLEIPRTAMHVPLLVAGFGLALVISLATLAGVLGGTWAGRRLGRQVASLTASPAANGPSLDITEIANARNVLDAAAASQRLNESRYQAIFEHASIGIAQATLEGLCVRVNRAVCSMFGYSPEELRVITWQELTPEDELPIDIAYVNRLMAGEMTSYTREKQFHARDGSKFWANLGVTLIRKADNTPDYFIAIVEHIQARKAAEAALAEQDALLSDMATLTHVGGWTFDPATGRGRWTTEAARIHDLPDAHPIDVTAGMNFYSEEHRPLIEAAVRKALVDATPYDLELEIFTASGQRKWVRTIGHPVVDKGKVVRMRGAIQDITEHKLAVLALAKSEQQYRQLVENANSVILQWAPNGTILYFNAYGQELFGWAEEEIVGQHVGILLPKRESTGTDISDLVQKIAACPDRFKHNINENIRRDGSRLWMSWTNTVLHDEHGHINAILAIGSDITEHKQLLEELKQRNRELEQFDRASVGRELQMIELKRQINELSRQLGQVPPFDLTFTEVSS